MQQYLVYYLNCNKKTTQHFWYRLEFVVVYYGFDSCSRQMLVFCIYLLLVWASPFGSNKVRTPDSNANTNNVISFSNPSSILYLDVIIFNEYYLDQSMVGNCLTKRKMALNIKIIYAKLIFTVQAHHLKLECIFCYPYNYD